MGDNVGADVSFFHFMAPRRFLISINVSFVSVRFNGTAKKSETEHSNFELSVVVIEFHFIFKRVDCPLSSCRTSC